MTTTVEVCATPYTFLEHTADAGIEATGATLHEAFASAADGLAGWLCDSRQVSEVDARHFSVSAPDAESLLVDWLNEVNNAFGVGRFAFCRFEVTDLGGDTRPEHLMHPELVSTGMNLRAIGFGEPLDPARHVPGAQVKSVTHHGTKISRTTNGWVVRVFLDI